MSLGLQTCQEIKKDEVVCHLPATSCTCVHLGNDLNPFRDINHARQSLPTVSHALQSRLQLAQTPALARHVPEQRKTSGIQQFTR